MKTIYFVFAFFILSTFLAATIINVPGDQPTIQAGINVAVDGDTVLVQPNTYIENINYNGKNITVASLFLTNQDTTYISQTIIDGDNSGRVVTFESGEDSIAILTGFTIQNGCAVGGSGGGISCRNSSNPSLENVTIKNNLASNNGGGISCNSSSPSLVNVTITNNSVGDWGGGIFCGWESSPSLENVTITNNLAGNYGGGICCGSSSPSLVNVIITNNSAYVYGGGGLYSRSSSPSLTNCIMWNDSPQEIYFDEYSLPNSITISFSDIQGGEAGIVTNNNGTVNWLEGNIDEDPLFVGTGGYPFSLSEDSPCIDAGNPDPIYYDPEDSSNPGYALYPAMGTIINDMGAYGGPNTIGWPVVGLDDNVIIHTPEVFLHQNYPNPFNPETTINYQLPEDSEVEIIIYNIKGQKVKQLVNELLPAGEHSVVWNGKDKNNKSISSGIYFYKLKAENYQKVRKMILLR